MKIDLENNKCTITKAEIDELFRLDNFEDFEEAVENLALRIHEGLDIISLYNYLVNGGMEQDDIY